jgi:branched-chain amino acid transport system substrate-binding protein
MFIFVPSGLGAPILRQLTAMGLERLGRKLLVAGAVLDEQQIDTIGDAALNLVSAFTMPPSSRRTFKLKSA